MDICNNCVLPSNFPGVSFDDEGVCNHCTNYHGNEILEKNRRKYEQNFINLVSEHKGKSEYDVLMCYSGGKDSTYTMKIFKEKYGLTVLAVTFDNGFISPKAIENMTTVADKLGVDHLTFRVRFDILKKIFRTAAKEELYPRKTLERASTICTSCITFVKFIALKTALEKEIPFIGYGWSPGQAPIQSSVMKTNPRLIRMTQKVVFDPLYKIVGDDIRPYFLEDKHFNGNVEFPYNVHPLAFLEYNESMIFEKLKELGWEKPDDTDPHSTNCLLNGLANQIHENRYGYNPYAFEIAKMVREGDMTREEGLKRFAEPSPLSEINNAKKRLSLD